MRVTWWVGVGLSLLLSVTVSQVSGEVLAEYKFEGGTEDSSGFGFHGELEGDAEIQEGRLFLPGGLDNGMSLDLGEFNPFGGQSNWSISFDFQTVDESIGALFSSDGSPAEEPWPADQLGSLNIFIDEGGLVVTDFWFIDAAPSLEFYNDDEVHRYEGIYDAETGDFIQIIDGEDESFQTFLDEDTGEPIDRPTDNDRTRVGDETNPDFGFEFNPDGFHGYFDNLVINTEGKVPDVSLLGDFDKSGVLDLPDVNLLSREIAGGGMSEAFDLNADTMVNDADLNIWVTELKETWFGDANLDGLFNTTDLVDVFQAGKYEKDVDAAWEEGDWSGDLRFNTTDLVNAFQDGGYEMGRRPAAAVPEPSTLAMIVVGSLAYLAFRRRRTR